MPILIYSILSGKLKKLSAGGLDAEFGDAAKQRIEPIPIESLVENVMTINKQSMQQLYANINRLEGQYGYGYKFKKNRSIVLSIFLGEIIVNCISFYN